jgi:hypothetical protein
MYGTDSNITVNTVGTLRGDGTGSVHSVEPLPRVDGISSGVVSGKDYEVGWEIIDNTLKMTPRPGYSQPSMEYLSQKPSVLAEAISGKHAPPVDLSRYEVKSIFGRVSVNTPAALPKGQGTEGSLGALTWAVR